LSNEYTAIVEEYRKLAPVYDRRWASYVAKSQAHSIAAIEDFDSRDSLLDVACGTGTMLQTLHECYPQARLAGCDISPEMLTVARRKLGSGISLKECPAEALDYPDNAFQLVTCNSALHYFPDASAALREMHRVLKPGGQLILTDWCNDFITSRIFNLTQTLLDAAHVRTLRQREFESLLNSAEFNITHAEKYKIDWFWGLITFSACKAA